MMLAPWVKAMKPSPSARQGFVQRTAVRRAAVLRVLTSRLLDSKRAKIKVHNWFFQTNFIFICERKKVEKEMVRFTYRVYFQIKAF
jgi:hypothetical protein